MDLEFEELMPKGWSPSQVRGFAQVTARVSAIVSGVLVSRTLTVRRQYSLTLPGEPCAEEASAGADPSGFVGMTLGFAFGSVLHINPVELGRFVETERRAAGGRP